MNFKYVVLFGLFLLSIGCEKDNFEINNPDVEEFVNQVKTGNYTQFYTGENGENLWLLMPQFTEEHIQSLIDFSNDTTHITAYPLNPVSSRTPFPSGKNYHILGECLLWTVEGIRNGNGYGSLDPYLIDTSLVEIERYNGLSGKEILTIRDFYNDWWTDFQDSDWSSKNPLENTPFIWF